MQEKMPAKEKGTANPTPLELLLNNMTFLEQFAQSVISFTSKYNSAMSILYAPENLIGKPAKYPNYGDFPDTYMLRSYGRWWNESEAAHPHYMTQDIDPIISEDYVTIRFECAVIPKSVSIYETYNPGAVVRIWARNLGGQWTLLWEGSPQHCRQTSRKFCPPIRQTRELVNEIRIDFNQSLLQYHTALDAVLLAGYKPKSILQTSLLQKGLLETLVCKATKPKKLQPCDTNNCDNPNLFATLPYEVIVHIFQYLDLQSLCRCAQVNKRWFITSLDTALYRELSLKRYWHKVDNTTLKLFMTKCKNLKKLDLAWCGNGKQITEDVFVEFLHKCCRNLTHLSLNNCNFVKELSLEEIRKCTDLTELRLRNCHSNSWQYAPLAQLKKLSVLDLYSSDIDDEMLIKILLANPDLKHLLLDFCERLERLDQVAETIAVYNWKLITWSSWKTHSLTFMGVGHLARCPGLRELDVGWCLILSEPGDCLERVALGCKDLRRLIICGWRGVSDHLLLPIIRSCKQLTQLDLLGIKNISGDICERVLASLPKLKLLDISFCDLVKQEQVRIWREQYPGVVIQRSCTTEYA